MKVSRIIIAVLFLIIIIFSGVYFYKTRYLQHQTIQGTAKQTKSSIEIKGHVLNIELARTDAEMSKGLSARRTLAEDDGMLFIFKQKLYPSFWMHDMNFPLDFIWIDEETIVDITKDVPNPEKGTKDTQLKLYSPTHPVNYVLEVNAGYCTKMGIEIGDIVKMNIN